MSKYFEMANEKYYQKNYEAALKLYDKAIEANKTGPSSHYNKAVCLIKLKKFNKAIVHLKEAITLIKDDEKVEATYFFNLACCYNNIQDYKKALIYFNYAWSLDNKDKACEEAISKILTSKFLKIRRF